MLFEAAIVAFAFTTGALESAQPVRLGAPAPSPTLSKLLNAPADAAATWSALQGQAVVLEFWATLVYTLRRANPAPE